MGAGKYARMMRRRGVDPCAYVPGLYTEAEVDDLINIDGYIPVATAAEFLQISLGGSQTMGGCSIWAGTYTTGLDKEYIQIFHIDASGAGNQFGIATTGTAIFSGIYDGNNFTITNIDQTGMGGTVGALFGTRVSGQLRNLTISSAPTKSFRISAICQVPSNNCVIENIHASGDISVARGLFRDTVHLTNGDITINNCSWSGTMIGTASLGGILANCASGTSLRNTYITNCTTSGTINSAAQFVAGLTGTVNAFCFIENCKTSMSITSATNSGGAFGQVANGGVVRECYSTGNVNGGSGNNVGGFIGNLANGTIENCYATGNVITTGARAGGFIGFANNASGSVTNCYSTGIPTSGSGAGGFIGINSPAATISASYWDTDTSGTTTSAAGTGQTTTDLQTPTSNTGIYSAWTIPPWDFGTSTDYPTLTTTP
jgi:hypothetical protein